jgi:hypothetical protein
LNFAANADVTRASDPAGQDLYLYAGNNRYLSRKKIVSLFCLRPVSEADAEGLGTTILNMYIFK